MNKKYKYLIGFLLIIGAFVYLFLTSFQSSLQYYVTVSELKKTIEPHHYNDKVLKVAGKAGPIDRVEEDGVPPYFHFTVLEGGDSLQVSYKGLAPDTFKEGAEVVVTGSILQDGTFKASHILAKCASKYEAKIQ